MFPRDLYTVCPFSVLYLLVAIMAAVQGWNILHLNTVPLEIHSVILKMFQFIQKGYLHARAWTEKQTHKDSANTQVQPTTYCAEPRKAKHTTFIRVEEKSEKTPTNTTARPGVRRNITDSTPAELDTIQYSLPNM